jgi:hypothetical protein
MEITKGGSTEVRTEIRTRAARKLKSQSPVPVPY